MPGTKVAFYLRFCAFLPVALTSLLLHGQASTGELRLNVTDSTGAGLPATVAIASEANQFRRELQTDGAGTLDLPALHFGLYSVRVHHPGFASQSLTVPLHSGVPTDAQVKLNIAPVTAAVQVSDDKTMIDPDRTSSIALIGKERIERRLLSLPGRSIQDLVNSQPGWLYEQNAVLHPDGSEYQTQFVLNGIPLTDNRSPSKSVTRKSTASPNGTKRAVFWATADRLNRCPHVLVLLHQIPTGRRKLVPFDLAALIDSLRAPDFQILEQLSPCNVAIDLSPQHQQNAF